MTPDELAALGEACYGAHWQTPLAAAMGTTTRQVRRWRAGATPIGPRLDGRLRAVLGAKDWPRDEWIVGEGQRRDYLVHARRPRFIGACLIGFPPEDGKDTLATAGGYQIPYEDTVFGIYELVWIDPPPPEAEATKLMAAAATAFRRLQERWAT